MNTLIEFRMTPREGVWHYRSPYGEVGPFHSASEAYQAAVREMEVKSDRQLPHETVT